MTFKVKAIFEITDKRIFANPKTFVEVIFPYNDYILSKGRGGGVRLF